MPRTSTKVTARRPRGRVKLRRPSPMTVLWGVVSLVLAITFLIIQGVLLLIFTLLSFAVTALSGWVDSRSDDATVPAPTGKRPGSASPRGNRRTGSPTAAVPPCTNTGKPIDVCGCSTRHVASSDGAARYRKPIGSPLGGRAPRQPAPSAAARKTPVDPTVSSPASRRPRTRKSSWYDSVSGTKCKTCKGSGSKTDAAGKHVDACPTCRGFGKVSHP